MQQEFHIPQNNNETDKKHDKSRQLRTCFSNFLRTNVSGTCMGQVTKVSSWIRYKCKKSYLTDERDFFCRLKVFGTLVMVG
jgi:hypothetical protein